MRHGGAIILPEKSSKKIGFKFAILRNCGNLKPCCELNSSSNRDGLVIKILKKFKIKFDKLNFYAKLNITLRNAERC